MTKRYKDDTFHMMDTFGKTEKQITGYGLTKQGQSMPMRGKAGNTWDARHMTNFLNQSNYSNWSEAGATFYSNKSNNHRRYNSSGDHFFKTTKDNKNQSKIGYTKVNPLVSIGKSTRHHKDVLLGHLQKKSPERYCSPKYSMRESGKFKFEGNSVKFRTTNPLTHQNVEDKHPTQFEKTRLRWLMEKRHPHGMTGIDHPEDPEAIFYAKTQVDSIRIRMEPNSHRTHFIDRDWKAKGKVVDDYKKQYGFGKAKFIQQRKFNNDDAHGYNIITNRFSAAPN